MPNNSDDEDSKVDRTIILGKYYAWRGGSGVRDDYSRRIVGFKDLRQSDLEYFAGRLARVISNDPELNKPTNVLIPVPSSSAHDPRQPHRGELLCQAVAAVPGIRVTYGNYVVRVKTIPSSHACSVASRPTVAEHLKTIEVRIPHIAGKYVTKLGGSQWRGLNAILFDDVRYFGATSEACAIKLRQAGFEKIYAIFLGQNQP